MKQLLYIDFEAAYDSKGKYDLRHQSMIEYVRSPLFKAFGVSYAFGDSKLRWVSGKDIPGWVDYVASSVDEGWPNVSVVGHNSKFDLTILREIYEAVPGQMICTKAMSKAVLGKSVKGHSLKDLAVHFGLPEKGLMKTDGLRDLTPEQEAELAEYCIHDTWLCREIYKKLAPDFPENQYEPMHQTIRMFVQPQLVLNVPLLEKTAREEAERRTSIFEKIGIPKSEFASNKKFPALLKSKGFDVPSKTSGRTGLEIPALALGDPEFLEMMESENDELRTLCEARIAAKSTLLETRSTKLASIGRTGYWPFDVEFSGADQTHRFSGGSGAGGNPQNFTRDSALREAVETPKGYSLCVGDFSNIELRVSAYLAKDPGLIQAIEAGIDIYCDFGSVYYGRRITKADKRERQFAKTAILGLGYGCGVERFIKMVRIQTGDTISPADAKKAVDLYRMRYSGITRLWAKVDEAIRFMLDDGAYQVGPVKFIKGGVELPSGLKLRYMNLRQVQEGRHSEWVYDVYCKGKFETHKLYGAKLVENITQALAGELLKAAAGRMGDSVVGSVHDELIVMCKRGMELVTVQKLRRAMTASPSWMPEIKLACEIGVGQNWNEAK